MHLHLALEQLLQARPYWVAAGRSDMIQLGDLHTCISYYGSF
jgi:hypothetical protein